MRKIEYDVLLYNNRMHNHFIYEETVKDVQMNSMHTHSHYEILYIYEGERELFVEEGKTYAINKNRIAFIPPYILHKTVGLNGSTQKKLLINFTKDFVDSISKFLNVDILSVFLRQTVIHIDGDEVAFVINTMREMIKYNNSEDLFDEQMFLMLLCSLLTFFAKKVQNTVEADNSSVLMDRIIKYMEKNFNQEITLEVLAKQFYVNKYEISRMFTKNIGVSFVEYLARIRIENAKELLRGTSLSITRIAEFSGFHSSSNFARVFKSKTGISPKKYRSGYEIRES